MFSRIPRPTAWRLSIPSIFIIWALIVYPRFKRDSPFHQTAKSGYHFKDRARRASACHRIIKQRSCNFVLVQYFKNFKIDTAGKQVKVKARIAANRQNIAGINIKNNNRARLGQINVLDFFDIIILLLVQWLVSIFIKKPYLLSFYLWDIPCKCFLKRQLQSYIYCQNNIIALRWFCSRKFIDNDRHVVNFNNFFALPFCAVARQKRFHRRFNAADTN